MDNAPANVVRLNQRAPTKAKEVFEDAVFEKYGRSDGRASFEFEQEVRAYLDIGSTARNRDLIQRVADTVGQANREKKFSQSNYPRHSETTIVQYRLPEHLIGELKAVAKDAIGTISEFVGRIMWRYATEGSVVERNNKRLERVATAVERETDESLSAPEKNTKQLVDALALDDGEPFSLEEFDEANNDSLGQRKQYARERYLPRVLDELDYTWSEAKTGVFVPSDVPSSPEDERDPRTKPYDLMDDADKEHAVKLAAYKVVADSSRTCAKSTVDDAVEALHGRAQPRTAKTAMRAVAVDTPGFEYDDTEDVLKVNSRKAVTPSEYDAGEEIEDNPDPTTTGEDETELGEPADEWFDTAVDSLEDILEDVPEQARENIARNKIARAKHPGKVENGEVSDDAIQSVTDEEIQRVREEVDGSDVDEYSEQEIEREATDRFDELAEAVPVSKGVN